MVGPRRRSCFYCGKSLSRQQLTRDHVCPRAQGGSDSKKNLVDCCRDCNEAKGCLTIEEFRVVMALRKGLLQPSKMLFPGEVESGGRVISPAQKPSAKKKNKKHKCAGRKKKENPTIEISLDISDQP